MIIVVLGVLAAVAVPKLGDVTESSKITATQKELATLKVAIAGNPDAIAGGKYVDRGFEGDVGFVPSRLQDLTKTYRWPILISQNTQQQVQAEFDAEFIDSVMVKGKTEPVNTYKVTGRKGAEPVKGWE